MILVTGSAGLLGRELVRQLAADGQHVRGIDLQPADTPDRVEPCAGDLLDEAACRHACRGVRTIIHTAARQYHSGLPRLGRRRFFLANVRMTRNLLQAAAEAGTRHMVFVSSDMVYGLPPGRALTERDETRPIGPYGRSKLASERACLEARQRGMQVTILRPRLIIGPGRLGVLRRLFDRIRHHRLVPILGRGRHRYQMVSVADVASACLLAVRRPCDETFNLGSHAPPTVRDLLADLIRRAGSRSRLLPLPGNPARAALWSLHAVRLSPLVPEQFRIADVDYVLDTARARSVLGWQPRWSDADMLFGAYETYVRSQ